MAPFLKLLIGWGSQCSGRLRLGLGLGLGAELRLRAGSAAKDAEHAFETAPAAGGFGFEIGFAGGFEIELKQ